MAGANLLMAADGMGGEVVGVFSGKRCPALAAEMMEPLALGKPGGDAAPYPANLSRPSFG